MPDDATTLDKSKRTKAASPFPDFSSWTGDGIQALGSWTQSSAATMKDSFELAHEMLTFSQVRLQANIDTWQALVPSRNHPISSMSEGVCREGHRAVPRRDEQAYHSSDGHHKHCRCSAPGVGHQILNRLFDAQPRVVRRDVRQAAPAERAKVSEASNPRRVDGRRWPSSKASMCRSRI